MRDGRTVKRKTTGDRDAGFEAWDATLVVIEGADPGAEHPLYRPRMVIGRGPAVDVALDDEAVSQQHAAVEFVQGGFRLVDLGSTNGTLLNDESVASGDLDHGDRFRLGGHVLQLVLEKHDAPPPVWVLDDE